MAKKKKHKNDVKTDLPIIMDYGIGSISVYDPADMMPYNEPTNPLQETRQRDEIRVQVAGIFRSD